MALALQTASKNTTTPAMPTFEAACDSVGVDAETNSHAPISALIQMRTLAAHAAATRMAASAVTIGARVVDNVRSTPGRRPDALTA